MQAAVPNWLREEIIKNKSVLPSAVSTQLPGNSLDSIGSEDSERSIRKTDPGDSKSVELTRSTEDEEDDEVLPFSFGNFSVFRCQFKFKFCSFPFFLIGTVLFSSVNEHFAGIKLVFVTICLCHYYVLVVDICMLINYYVMLQNCNINPTKQDVNCLWVFAFSK